jgi:hypothetical protein
MPQPAVASHNAPWSGQPWRWLGVRFTLEEAFFLQHVLRCLQVMRVEAGGEQLGLSRAGVALQLCSSTEAAASPVVSKRELEALNDEVRDAFR